MSSVCTDLDCDFGWCEWRASTSEKARSAVTKCQIPHSALESQYNFHISNTTSHEYKHPATVTRPCVPPKKKALVVVRYRDAVADGARSMLKVSVGREMAMPEDGDDRTIEKGVIFGPGSITTHNVPRSRWGVAPSAILSFPCEMPLARRAFFFFRIHARQKRFHAHLRYDEQ